jgi:hypothetical protein
MFASPYIYIFQFNPQYDDIWRSESLEGNQVMKVELSQIGLVLLHEETPKSLFSLIHERTQ